MASLAFGGGFTGKRSRPHFALTCGDLLVVRRHAPVSVAGFHQDVDPGEPAITALQVLAMAQVCGSGVAVLE